MEKKKTGATKKPGARLTHTFADSVTRPASYGDGRGGNGLSLLVKARKKEGVRKTWFQKIRIKGKIRTRGLGKFPDVTLAEARDKAKKNAHLVAQGVDITKPPPTIPTVGQAIETVIKDWEDGWKHPSTKTTWYRRLKRCRSISSVLVSDLTKEDVIKLLRPIWRDKPRTAEDLRLHLSAVMRWSIDEGHRTMANPVPKRKEAERRMGNLPEKTHYRSLDYRQLGTALATVRDADTWWAAKYLNLFIAFTCVRNGEARKATWEEIDWDNAIWNIPGIRMKNGLAHSIPLSIQAMRILTYAHEKTGRTSGTIFPPEKGGQFMDKGIPSKLLKKLGVQFTPHGLRSSFRNWAGARAREHFPQPAAEMVLAHKVGPQIQQAYMTSDFLEEREPIMQEWANFLRKKMGPPISTIPEVQPENKDNFLVKTFDVDAIGEAEYELITQKFQKSQTQVPDQNTLCRAVDIAAIALMRDSLLWAKKAVSVRWSDLKQKSDGSGRLTVRNSNKKRSGADHVAYASPRTMKLLDEVRRIRRDLGMEATDTRIFQIGINQLRDRIKDACKAAGLKGNYSGLSPRNGMEQDLVRCGFRDADLRRAKRWEIPASLDHAQRERQAGDGAVAQWYAQKAKETST